MSTQARVSNDERGKPRLINGQHGSGSDQGYNQSGGREDQWDRGGEHSREQGVGARTYSECERGGDGTGFGGRRGRAIQWQLSPVVKSGFLLMSLLLPF